MEIKAEIISGYGVAGARNEGIRSFLEDAFPELKGWVLGTINAKIISPQGINVRKINTAKMKEIDIPPILYLKHPYKYLHNNEEYLSGEIWRNLPQEKMKLVPVRFKIDNKVVESDGFLYIPSGSPHPQDGTIELIAKEKLRENYNVGDDDKIIITVNQ